MITYEATSADEWQDVVSGCFIPLACQSFAPAFHGLMEHAKLGDSLSFSQLTTDGTIVERSPRLAANAESDDLHVSLQKSSAGYVAQDGHSVPVRTGSITVYATDRPYRQDYSRPQQSQLIIQVSRRALRLPDKMIDDARERLLVPPSAAGSLLFRYLERAVGDDGVEGVALDLVETLLHGSFASGPLMPRTTLGMLEAIRDYVERNFRAPSLNVDSLAAAHFLSRRRLYQLFEHTDESPGDWIRSRRLEYGAALLRSPDHRALEIREVSERSGFSDATTFARAFRREYGANPSDCREAPVHSLSTTQL